MSRPAGRLCLDAWTEAHCVRIPDIVRDRVEARDGTLCLLDAHPADGPSAAGGVRLELPCG
ncbi:MAG: hypothetical protein U0869_19575 [Chloroflexota bacterium]